MFKILIFFKNNHGIIIPIGLFLTLFAGISIKLFVYFQPYLFAIEDKHGERKIISHNIISGPYPHQNSFESLIEGSKVTTFISLLDGERIPSEKFFVDLEKQNSNNYDITYVNFPLTYYNLDGDEDKAQLMKINNYILAHPNEKFYIHGYAGKYRNNAVVQHLLKNGTINPII